MMDWLIVGLSASFVASGINYCIKKKKREDMMKDLQKSFVPIGRKTR